jgi:SAM-dependent methyltransferase
MTPARYETQAAKEAAQASEGGRPVHERHQGEHPRGLLGRVMATGMGWWNAPQNRLTVGQLRLGPADAVLEIGFGPGHALKRISEETRARLIAGVDHSDLMVRTAARRNRRAIREERMLLRQGDVAALPFADCTFAAAFAVNSYHQWDDPSAALGEIRRVLRPGGRVVLSIRILHRDRRWETVAEGRTCAERAPRDLSAAGFTRIAVDKHDLGKLSVVLVSGVRPEEEDRARSDESRSARQGAQM